MKDIIARKIPLEGLLTHLERLYELGVDYIDLIGHTGDECDMIGIIFSEDYMDEEFKDNFEHLDNIQQEGEPFNPDKIDDII